MGRFLFQLVFLIILSSVSNSEPQRWKFIGPGSLRVGQLVPDRNHPNLWFVTLHEDRGNSAWLSRSIDGGRTWRQTSLREEVLQIRVQPKTSELFAITRNSAYVTKLWVSTNHGSIFHFRGNIPDFNYGNLILDPLNPRVMYTVTGYNDDVRVSRNGGKDWTKIHNFPRSYLGCPVRRVEIRDLLLFHSKLYATAYMPLSDCSDQPAWIGALLLSQDHGKNWKIISNIPAPADEGVEDRFHTDPAFPDRFFIHGLTGVWELTSNGLVQLLGYPVSQMTSVPGRPEQLIAIQEGIGIRYGSRIFCSDDTGITWHEDPESLNNTIGIIQAMDGPAGGFLAGTYAGLFHKDSTHSWSPRNTGLRKGRFNAIEFVDGRSPRLYAMTGDGAVVYRKNGPENDWQNLITRYSLDSTERIQSLFVNPHNLNHVVLTGTDYGVTFLMISMDAGESWRRSTIIFNDYCSPVIDFGNNNTLYVGCSHFLFKSTDGGHTGQRILSQLAGYIQVPVDDHNTSVFYILTDSGFYKSEDAGQSARRLRSPRYATRLALLPERNALLLGVTEGKFFLSLDCGEHWRYDSKADLPSGEECEHGYECSPSELWAENSNHYFMLTASQLMYETLDGKHWNAISPDALTPGVRDMTDPRRHPFFLATDKGVVRVLKGSSAQ